MRAARQGLVMLLASVPPALEYEAVCREPKHCLASGLSSGEIDFFLSTVIAMAEPVESYFLWRPQFRDRADDIRNCRLWRANFSRRGGTFNVPAKITDEVARKNCHARRHSG